MPEQTWPPVLRHMKLSHSQASPYIIKLESVGWLQVQMSLQVPRPEHVRLFKLPRLIKRDNNSYSAL